LHNHVGKPGTEMTEPIMGLAGGISIETWIGGLIANQGQDKAKAHGGDQTAAKPLGHGVLPARLEC
jgi:hypothetical protein